MAYLLVSSMQEAFTAIDVRTKPKKLKIAGYAARHHEKLNKAIRIDIIRINIIIDNWISSKFITKSQYYNSHQIHNTQNFLRIRSD